MTQTGGINFDADVKSITGFNRKIFKNRQNKHLMCKCFTVLQSSTFEKVKSAERWAKIYKNTFSNTSSFLRGQNFSSVGNLNKCIFGNYLVAYFLNTVLF